MLRYESSTVIAAGQGVITYAKSTDTVSEVGGASIRAKFTVNSNDREAKAGAWALLVKPEAMSEYYVAIGNVRSRAECDYGSEAELIVFAQPEGATGKDDCVHFLCDQELRILFPWRGGAIHVKMVEYLDSNKTVACEGPWLRDRVCLLCRDADIRWARDKNARKKSKL